MKVNSQHSLHLIEIEAGSGEYQSCIPSKQTAYNNEYGKYASRVSCELRVASHIASCELICELQITLHSEVR